MGGNTLILCHKNAHNPDISDKGLLDDVLHRGRLGRRDRLGVDLERALSEFDWSEAARNALFRNPNVRNCGGDWAHVNSMSALGPNKWFDAGDARFHPDNIIWSSREANIIAITDKRSGKVVWKIGPDYHTSPALKKLGWIIGKHHAHLIPRGLPGEGNLLVFDNGGWAGYGAPNPGAPTGGKNALARLLPGAGDRPHNPGNHLAIHPGGGGAAHALMTPTASTAPLSVPPSACPTATP